MISEADMTKRVSRLRFYHLIEVLYFVQGNGLACVLRPNSQHPRFNERLHQDFACIVRVVGKKLQAETFVPKHKKFFVSEKANV